MRANRAYRLVMTKSSAGPSLLADPRRVDSLEIVEIVSGEVVLFWDRPAREAARMARAIKSDLSQLEAAQFLTRWREFEPQ